MRTLTVPPTGFGFSHPRLTIVVALALACAALFTGPRVALFDPDEGYYPATAAESVDNGAWWDLRFNGEPRWEKPILAYALIEGAFTIFGRTAAAARVPSAIEGAVLVLIVGIVVSRLAGRRAGGLSAAILSTTLGVQVFARAAHPEIAVVLAMATTQLLIAMCLIVPSDRHRPWLPIAIGAAVGYGLLAKGPVAAVVPGLGFLAAAPWLTDVRRRWPGALRVGLAAAVVAAAVAFPWYAAMTARHGTQFLRDALWKQNVGRYTGQLAVHHHSLAVLVFPTAAALMPWTTVLPAALWAARRSGRGTPATALAFCMAMMAATTFVFYSLAASTLASYSLALVPPLAVVIGVYLDDALSRVSWSALVSFRTSAAMLALIACGLGVIAVSHERFIRTRDLVGGLPDAQTTAMLRSAVLPPAVALLAGAALIWLLRDRGRIVALCVVGAVLPVTTLLAARPILEDAYPWQHFGAHVAGTPDRIWIHTYRAPSLTFYAGRPVERVLGDEALEALLAHDSPGWVVLETPWEKRPELTHQLTQHHAAIVERTRRLLLVHLCP